MPKVKAHPLPCPFCKVPTYNFSQYTKHLQIYHEHENKFKISCHDSDCKKTFTRVFPYIIHNKRNHATKEFLDYAAEVSHSEKINNTGKTECEHIEVNNPTESKRGEDQESVKEEFTMHFAKYLLRLKERHMLPDNVQRSLISELEFFLNFSDNIYKKIIDQCFLEENGSYPKNSQTYKALKTQGPLFDEEINAVNSKFKLRSYIAANFPYVSPQAFYLSVHDRASIYHYVPVIEMLKAVLSRIDVQKQIQQNEHSYHHPNVLYDTCDGECSNTVDCLSNPIKLHMYIDEFEICNPIGSKRGEYKLTAVYFAIGNLPKIFRNKEDTIFLCLLVRHKFLKLYDPTYQKLFQPLITDLQTLQNGIEYDAGFKKLKFTAVLEFVLGDNLSSHAVAGFQTNFNSGSFCRFCSIRYSEFRNTLCISKLRERNSVAYAHQIKFIDKNAADAAIYGIKHRCALSQLNYFTVPESFPSDIMHDCLEGIIPLTVQLVLKELYKENLVTVKGLNESLLQTRVPVSDKPNFFNDNFFSGNGKIVGKASQKLELFLVLPQLVDLSSVGNSAAWDVYIALRKCMDFILSPVVEKDHLPHLAGLIESYILKFKSTFGHSSLIPKHHFMMHFPSQIEKFGPLRNLWCMRFEAKHQYFKKLIANTRNFKNVTHTLTERHQMRVAHALASSIFLHEGKEPQSAVISVDVNSLPQSLKLALQDKIGKPLSNINTVKCLKVDGVSYNTNSSACYILDCNDETPCFAQVKHIVLVEKEWYFCLKLLLPKKYNEIAHAYEVELHAGWIIVLPESLLDSHMHRTYRKDKVTYAYSTFYVTKYLKAAN